METDVEILIRDRAYQIWEDEGHPDGFAVEHWVRAEREILNGANESGQIGFDAGSSDKEGIAAAREYERGVKKFEARGEAEAKAEEAERAIEGPEREGLKSAEQVGKRGKGEDLAGNR